MTVTLKVDRHLVVVYVSTPYLLCSQLTISGCKRDYLTVLKMLKQNKSNICVNICPANNRCLQCLESLKTLLKALGLATNIWKTGFSPKSLPGDLSKLWETSRDMLVIGIPNVSAWTCCCIIKSDKISDQRIPPPHSATQNVSWPFTCLCLILRRFKRKLPVYTGVNTTFILHRLISSAFKWRNCFSPHSCGAAAGWGEESGELQFKRKLTCSSFFRCCGQQWRVHTFHVSVSGRRQEQTDISLFLLSWLFPLPTMEVRHAPLFGIKLWNCCCIIT